jgi:hypothetical protein
MHWLLYMQLKILLADDLGDVTDNISLACAGLVCSMVCPSSMPNTVPLCTSAARWYALFTCQWWVGYKRIHAHCRPTMLLQLSPQQVCPGAHVSDVSHGQPATHTLCDFLFSFLFLFLLHLCPLPAGVTQGFVGFWIPPP